MCLSIVLKELFKKNLVMNVILKCDFGVEFENV